MFLTQKFNILGTPFLENNVDSIKCSTHTLEINDNDEIKSLKFYDSSIKPVPYFSRLLPIINDHSMYFKYFEHRILTYFLTAYDCEQKYADGTILYASKFYLYHYEKMFFSIRDINNLEYPYQSLIQNLLRNLLNQPLTLVKRLIGYAQQDFSLNDFQTTKIPH